jgi:hypothetical protein
VLPAAPPTFNPPAGTYTGAQTVTISDSTPGASIFYTTDGSDPTATSTPYTDPIRVSASETLRAIAFAPGYLPSAVAPSGYTIVIACGAPVLKLPLDGAVQSSDSLAFGWLPLADCTFSGYVVRIKNVASMDSGGLTLVDTVVPTAQYATTLSSANENMDLFWGVRAANAPAGATWTVRRFRIARVQVGVTRNPPAPPQRPGLTASLTARSGCGAIQAILFGPPGRPLANAVVTMLPAGPQFTGTSRYVPPPGTTQVSFLVERSAAAGGATVPLVLSDGCGDWESLVGGGPDAFK